MPRNKQAGVVVNADDFGLSESINAGVFQSAKTGIVSSVSLASNGAAFGQAVLMLADLDVSAGWHVNLTSGFPVSKCVPSLLKDDRFMGKIGFLHRFFAGKIKVAHIKRELDAQLNRLLKAGIRLTHADGHHDIHFLPGLAQILANYFRCAHIDHVRYAGSRLGLLDDAVKPVNILSHCLHRLLSENSPYHVPKRHINMVWGRELYFAKDKDGILTRYLLSAGDGIHLIVCHPSDFVEKPVYNLRYNGGSKELTALCSETLKNKATFISFNEL
ncbi:ChbG/HpnK family deacetylase [candidate division KSB1 bacterium]|nr:ChbG/HpnK family deacetylase [candidate division KSB1 bacterium]